MCVICILWSSFRRCAFVFYGMLLEDVRYLYFYGLSLENVFVFYGLPLENMQLYFMVSF